MWMPALHSKRSSLGSQHVVASQFFMRDVVYVIRARPGDKIPVGYVWQWVGAVPDDDHLICDGRLHCNKTYPELARLLAGKYGGDKPPSKWWLLIGLYGWRRRRWEQSGALRVPDLRGRVMVGVDVGGPTHP